MIDLLDIILFGLLIWQNWSQETRLSNIEEEIYGEDDEGDDWF